MLKIMKTLLDTEKNLVFSERAKGKFVVRPTTILTVIFSLLYLLAPIDILPEGLIEPSICGFIDDLIILCISGYIVYLDIGGEIDGFEKLQNGKVSKKKQSNGKNRVCTDNKPIHENTDVSSTDTNLHNSDVTEEDTFDIVSNDDGSSDVNNFDDLGIGGCEAGDDGEIFIEEESSFRL